MHVNAAPKGGVVPRRRKCGAMEVHNRLLEQHPDFRRVLGDLEHATRARLAQPLARAAGPVKILVVVHVVWRTQIEKIGKPQMDSQIDALNRDYRARNPDKSNAPRVWSGLATDAFVEFTLATLDPSGNYKRSNIHEDTIHVVRNG